MTAVGEPGKRRANVVGTGMIGGSIAAALRKRGWYVSAYDRDESRLDQALKLEIIDVKGIDPTAEITFVATPVDSVASVASEALERGGMVTDVASVKCSVAKEVSHANFVAGHPMAGSERSGPEAANPDLFEGATWVLTPDEHTDPHVYLEVRNIVASLGAVVVTLPAAEHDRIVAVTSHVPHLVASALMNVAADAWSQHASVFRLAATGFRDMTRVAAGHPGLWAGISYENSDAISEALGRLIDELSQMRDLIAAGDREKIHNVLAEAAEARSDLPRRSGGPVALHLMRIPVPDAPGALGEVLTMFGGLRVNVEDMIIAHDPKGDRGVLEITVAAEDSRRVCEALEQKGLRSSVEVL